MNEYSSIWELAINGLFWFVLGTFASYIIFRVVGYLDGRKD